MLENLGMKIIDVIKPEKHEAYIVAQKRITDGVPVETHDIRLTDKTIVTFASVDDAMGLLGARDNFMERMGPFDRMVRMKSLRPLPIIISVSLRPAVHVNGMIRKSKRSPLR